MHNQRVRKGKPQKHHWKAKKASIGNKGGFSFCRKWRHTGQLRTTQNGFRLGLLAETKAKPIGKGMPADYPGVPHRTPRWPPVPHLRLQNTRPNHDGESEDRTGCPRASGTDMSAQNYKTKMLKIKMWKKESKTLGAKHSKGTS